MGIPGPNFRDLGHPAWLGELAKGNRRSFAYHPRAEIRSGPLSLRMTRSILWGERETGELAKGYGALALAGSGALPDCGVEGVAHFVGFAAVEVDGFGVGFGDG